MKMCPVCQKQYKTGGICESCMVPLLDLRGGPSGNRGAGGASQEGSPGRTRRTSLVNEASTIGGSRKRKILIVVAVILIIYGSKLKDQLNTWMTSHQKVTSAQDADAEIVEDETELEEAEYEDAFVEDTSIHSYTVYLEDCTWAEAKERAEASGGYLVRINSVEEYDYLVDNVLADLSTYHFYLGGRRDGDGTEYYWVNTDNEFIGDCLNTDTSWSVDYWYKDEPSYVDGDVAEDVMNLFCVGGTWYLNDSSADLVGNYPDYLTGLVGYIVEYE